MYLLLSFTNNVTSSEKDKKMSQTIFLKIRTGRPIDFVYNIKKFDLNCSKQKILAASSSKKQSEQRVKIWNHVA